MLSICSTVLNASSLENPISIPRNNPEPLTSPIIPLFFPVQIHLDTTLFFASLEFHKVLLEAKTVSEDTRGFEINRIAYRIYFVVPDLACHANTDKSCLRFRATLPPTSIPFVLGFNTFREIIEHAWANRAGYRSSAFAIVSIKTLTPCRVISLILLAFRDLSLS